MNIKELKKIGLEELTKNNIDDAVVKINILLEFVLKMSKTELIINNETEVDKNKITDFLLFVQKIVAGIPVQYITNYQSFMGIDFFVNEKVLIPQPDTEILVEKVIEDIKKINRDIKVIDLCTGSGAIAVTIANFCKTNNINNVKIYASDISKDALNIAQKNALNNNVDSYIKFINSDMFENINEIFDIIVSNPPYIEKSIIKTLSKEVQNEPYIALDGGIDGLDFYRIIAREGRKYLNKEGKIFLEIGYNQKENVRILFNNYENVNFFKDLSGNDRVAEIETNKI